MIRAFAVVCCVAVIPTVAFSQRPFPDTPDEHWAAGAVDQLERDGVLAGYPSGLFRGGRPASRYEMAVAVHDAYQRVKQITDQINNAALNLARTVDNGPDLEEHKNATGQLRNELAELKNWAPDIENLKKLAGMFEKELTSLGLDVEQFKVDLADLQRRLGSLESTKLPIDIHGDASLLFLGGASADHRPGAGVDGRLIGVRKEGSSLVQVGLTENFTMFHELALRLSSNASKGPNWRTTIVESNILGSVGAYPSQSSTEALASVTAGPSALYVQNMELDLSGRASAALGRVGYAIDPYIFQRPNINPYFENDRWSNGLWTFDGGIFGVPIGPTTVTVFGGQQSSSETTGGAEMQPMVAGSLAPRLTPGSGQSRPIGLPASDPATSAKLEGVPVDEHMGANLNLPFRGGKLDLAYIWLESNGGIDSSGGIAGTSTLSRAANNVRVMGGDLNWNFGALRFSGGYSQSNVSNGAASVVDRNNYAWHAQGSYESSRWGFDLGYREIQPLFAAPGDWGRIGLWWNPTDIKGPQAGVHLNVTPRIRLSATGEWYTGTGNTVQTPAGTFSGLGTGDRIDRYTAELGYKLGSVWQLTLGAELVDWNLRDRDSEQGNPTFLGGKPFERWYNLGIGYSLSRYASLSFLWQISDYSPGLTSSGMPVSGFGLPTRDGRASGNLITTQLTIKF